VRAQSPGGALADGLRAYRDLKFDAAAQLLSREAARLAETTGPAKDRVTALVYLGAADLFRGRRDSAAAVFRRLVLLDPRYRPDQLVFPPEVTSLFDDVRQTTKAVAIVAPVDTAIVPGVETFGVWLVATSSQMVEVTLRYEDGGPFRPLYYGPIADSLSVRWDGLDAAKQTPAVERILLRVVSRDLSGRVAGTLQLPLGLRLASPDTVPWPHPPPDSLFLPERAGSRRAVRALIGGAFLSAAVVSLPVVIGGSETSARPRLAVAGTLGLAGLFGYLLHRPGRPLEANVRANEAVRQAWGQRVAALRAENARRASDVRLVIHSGEGAALQPRAP
jgi:hypothetical protein